MSVKIASIVSVLVFTSFAYSQISQEELAVLFKQHSAHLKNTQVPQNPLMIVFSGTPGMGKSTIAKKLEDALCAVRISTDEIRDFLFRLRTTVSEKEFDEALQQYMVYFFDHFKAPNRRFILDASIDRRYKLVFPFLEKNKIDVIVIRLEVPRELVVERLREREGKRIEWFLKHLDAWFMDYDNFAKIYRDYIPYANAGDSQFDELKAIIKQKIELAAQVKVH